MARDWYTCMYSGVGTVYNLLFCFQGNVRSWLLDENCYDQSVVQYKEGSTVAVCQNTPHEIKIVTEREVSL